MTEETKSERFERVLAPRLDKIADAFRLMHNLTGSRYESTPDRWAALIQNFRVMVEGLAEAWGVPPAAPRAPAVQPQPDPAPIFQPAPASPPSAAPAPAPGTTRSAVDGIDRRDIREALRTLVRAHGPNDPGVAALTKIVLGWPVPDRIEGQ